MKSKSQSIVDAAVALPEHQRRSLIKRLLRTLPNEEEFWKEELIAELNRRSEEIKQGRSKPIPWSELKKLW